MIGYRHGALAVIENPQPRDVIVAELKRIDDRLFVERQIGFDQVPVWCVVAQVGGDHPPITILEWRDADGEPIPYLTSTLIARVMQMERNGKRLADSVIDKNRKLIERRQEEAREKYRELGRDMVPRIVGNRSAVLPRGQYLRRSRDAKRAKGWKV